jgi:hypothetical protein
MFPSHDLFPVKFLLMSFAMLMYLFSLEALLLQRLHLLSTMTMHTPTLSHMLPSRHPTSFT